MSHAIERYQSVIFSVPKWTKWWRHKWIQSIFSQSSLPFGLKIILTKFGQKWATQSKDMKVSFFQYQNGLNNDDIINGCGLFPIINSCNFALRLLLPNNTRQVLQRHIKLQNGAKKLQSGAAFSNYKVGQNNYWVGQLKNCKVGQKNHKVGQVSQSGAKNSQMGAKITKRGITVAFNLRVLKHFVPWVIFRLGAIETFWAQKIRQENLSKFITILNCNKSSCIIFWVKLF